MTKANTEEKRKTYSLDPEKSRDLARHALDMGQKLGKTVPRQAILDALVDCLKEKSLFEKVLEAVKKL